MRVVQFWAMRSPLESEPDLVSGVGLVTVRWALLDDQLSQFISFLTKSEEIGRILYYSCGSFQQRIAMIEAALTAMYGEKDAVERIRATFKNIRRLWATRNRLIHSHYVFNVASMDGFATTRTNIEGPELSDKSLFRSRVRSEIRRQGEEAVLATFEFELG